MSKTATITISIPISLVLDLNKIGKGINRSEVCASALESAIKRYNKRSQNENYR